MTSKDSLSKFFKLFDFIFPLYLLVYFIEFYLGRWGISVVAKFFSIILCVAYSNRILKRASQNSYGFHKQFTILYVYIILSFIMYLFNDVPIKCYVNELYNMIPAMFLVYVGMADDPKSHDFYKKFLLSCTVCMVIGLFLYVTAPGWYIDRRLEIVNNTWYASTTYGEDSLMQSMRFSSYLFDTYEADMLAMVGLSIALFLYYYKEGKQGVWGLFFILINFIAAVLTQQRVAMASATAMLFFYFVWGFTKQKSIQSSKLIVFFLLTLFFVSAFFLVRYGDRVEQISDLLLDRSENMKVSSAMGERTKQFETVMKNWTMPIFGHGAGSGGAVAGAFGLPHVNDGGWIEFLYEYGIVGMIMLIVFLLTTIRRGLRHMRYYMIELGIIAFVLVAMIGSNTLTLGYMTIFPFWYAIGRIWNKSYYECAVTNKIKI